MAYDGGLAPSILAASQRPFNYIVNGDGEVQQAGATTLADDTYGGHDCWYALTQTGAIAPSLLTNPADGIGHMMRLTQSQASAQRMGYGQIIEAQRCRKLRGQNVTLSGLVKSSVTTAVRFAILEWTGTADAVTSDVVNNWASTSYTAGGFFTSTTLTVRAVGTFNTKTSVTLAKPLTARLGSTFNNLIIVIWTEPTVAQNVTLDFALQLQRGTKALPFEQIDYAEKLRQCQRYFYRRLGSTTVPVGLVQAYSTSAVWGTLFSLPVTMRTAPTVTVSAASDLIPRNANGTDVTALSAVTFVRNTQAVGISTGTGSSGLVAGNASSLGWASANAYIDCDANL